MPGQVLRPRELDVAGSLRKFLKSTWLDLSLVISLKTDDNLFLAKYLDLMPRLETVYIHADDKQGCRGNGVECGNKLLYALGTHCPLLRELGVINFDNFTQDGIVTFIKGCPLVERLDCAACCFSDLMPALRTVQSRYVRSYRTTRCRACLC
jgi:hypothetical protein